MGKNKQRIYWTSNSTNATNLALALSTALSKKYLYTGGFYSGNVNFGPFQLTGSTNMYQGFVTKQDKITGEYVWAIPYNVIDNYGIFSIVYASGALYVSGITGINVFVSKISKKGEVLWTKTSTGATTSQSYNMVISDKGEIIISFVYTGPVVFEGIALDPLDTGTIGLVALDQNGNVLWAQSLSIIDGPYDEDIYNISIAINGRNLYIAGSATYNAPNVPPDSITVGLFNLDTFDVIWSSNVNMPDVVADVSPHIKFYCNKLYLTAVFDQPILFVNPDNTVQFKLHNNNSPYPSIFIATLDKNGYWLKVNKAQSSKIIKLLEI